MKKWHILLIAAIFAIAVFSVSGVMVYKYYITPKYIEPIVEEISEYVQKDDVLDALYEEAIALHEDGVIEDTTYANFVRAYNEYKRDDVEYAKNVLENNESDSTVASQNNSVSLRYGSNKVGVETIQVNDSDENGKADVQYSKERTSDRIKAEDVVEAEKIIEESENEEATPTPDTVKSAYEKLRSNMKSDEFSSFTRIMTKLDVDTLKSLIADKEGLKNYLHAELTDDEYSTIVNLGYKYVYIFIEN